MSSYTRDGSLAALHRIVFSLLAGSSLTACAAPWNTSEAAPPGSEDEVVKGRSFDDGEALGEHADPLLSAPEDQRASAAARDAFDLRVVTQGLFSPFEISWGPDGYLWLTERVGRRILRVNPDSGERLPVITIDEAFQTAGQDGVLGMALHPELLSDTGNDYLYVAYTYDADPGPALLRRAKIRRYTYDPDTQTAKEPLDLLTNLSANIYHNSGRLLFGPDSKLYYTIGDQGGNLFENMCTPIRAQELPTQAEVDAGDRSKYVGKVLRLNLDGSIPSDNPTLEGVRSHIYSYGHRNPQGLVFSVQGKLYSDEHGPKSDDELNWIRAGRNYGWPNVAGFRDDKAYAYENWSQSSPVPCADLEYSDYLIPPSVPILQETEFRRPDFTPPLRTFYTVPSGFNFQDPACAGADLMCWPTIAPSSLDYYAASGQIPGWGHSLLLTSLKDGAVFRARLNRAGSAVIGSVGVFLKTTNRYRDLTISPDGGTLYVITDNEGITKATPTGYTDDLEHRGAILEFKYRGHRQR